MTSSQILMGRQFFVAQFDSKPNTKRGKDSCLTTTNFTHRKTAPSCSLTISRRCSSAWQTPIVPRLINNVTLLAKVAKEFNVPAVITAVETESFSGYVWPQLLDVFPGQPVVERTSMNSWDDAGFRKAIEATGKKNIIMTGLWTEVCVTWPTIEMLGAGYNIYVVEDCCGATSPAAQEAALSRMVQAGAVRLTTIARAARMAARLGEPGTLQRADGHSQATGGRLRRRR